MAKFFNSYTGEWEDREPTAVPGASGPTLSSAALKPSDEIGLDSGVTYKRDIPLAGAGNAFSSFSQPFQAAKPSLPEAKVAANDVNAPLAPGMDGTFPSPDHVTDKDLPTYLNKAVKAEEEKTKREAANGAPGVEAPVAPSAPAPAAPSLAQAVASAAPKRPTGGGGGGGPSSLGSGKTNDPLRQNLSEIDKATDAQASALKAEAEQRAEHAKVEADEAIGKQALYADFEEKRQTTLASAKTNIEAKMALMEKQHADLQQRMAEQGQGYWADKSTGNKIAAGISIALNGIGAAFQNYGAALQGRQGNAENLAVKTIEDAINQDAALKAKRVANAEKLYEQAGRGVEGAKKDRQEALAEIGIEKSAALETAAAQLEARLKRLGATDEEVAGNRTLAELRQKALVGKQSALSDIASVEMRRAQVSIQQAELGLKRAELGLKAEAAKGKAPMQAGATVNDKFGNPIALVPQKYGGNEGAGHAVKQAEAINQANANYLEMRDLMQKLEEHQAKHGTVRMTIKGPGGVDIPASGEGAVREQMANRVMMLAKEQDKLGAIMGADMGFLEGQFGSKSEMMLGKGGTKLKAAASSLDQKMARLYASNGWNGEQMLRRVRGEQETPAQGASPSRPSPDAPPPEIIQQARDRLAKNPNDDTARRFLERYGAR